MPKIYHDDDVVRDQRNSSTLFTVLEDELQTEVIEILSSLRKHGEATITSKKKKEEKDDPNLP